MTILSLFDGMSCGQIALRDLGYPVTRYYASEIDRHAINQTQLNFPDTVQLGDVEKWREWKIDWSSVDLLIGGSPCQGFSFAGKQLAFDDPRSRLFFCYVDILNHLKAHNPNVKFLLENVVMRSEHINVITEHLGVQPVLINSSLVSAQNRKRLYWSDIKTRREGLFSELYTDIEQPDDKGILVRDILEDEVDEKYYLSKSGCEWIIKHGLKKNKPIKILGDNGKSSCLTVSTTTKYNLDSDFVIQRPRGGNKGGVFVKKSPTLTSCGYEHNNVLAQPFKSREIDSVLVAALRGRGKEVFKQHLEPQVSGKSNCITSVSKDNLVVRGGVFRTHHDGRGFRPLAGDKFGTLTARAREDGSGQACVSFRGSIRRLTPTECARLQTIPSWYQWACSDSQAYKMLGNGWTVEVIKHIFKYL